MNHVRVDRPARLNHSLSTSPADVNRYRMLLNWFKQYHSRYSCHMPWPQSVSDILNHTADFCFVPAYILAWTCCRSAELKQISLYDIVNRRVIDLQSSKSKHVRKIYPLILFKSELLKLIDPRTLVSLVSYDQLRYSMKQARISADVHLPDGALNCTHIFRHLIATHLSKQNVSLEDISYKLGHSSPQTTMKYIHKTD